MYGIEFMWMSLVFLLLGFLADEYISVPLFVLSLMFAYASALEFATTTKYIFVWVLWGVIILDLLLVILNTLKLFRRTVMRRSLV